MMDAKMTETPIPDDRDARQRMVAAWIKTCFGPDHAISMQERVARIVEEVAELAQAESVPAALCARIFEHVYARSPGAPLAETGGVCVTLLGYAAARGFSLHDAEALEIARLHSLPVARVRARQAEKSAANISVLLNEDDFSAGAKP